MSILAILKENYKSFKTKWLTDHPTRKLPPRPFLRSLFSLEDEMTRKHLKLPKFTSYNPEEFKRYLEVYGANPNGEGQEINKKAIGIMSEQLKMLEMLHDPSRRGLKELCHEYVQEPLFETELIYEFAETYLQAFEALNQKNYESFWELKRLARNRHREAIQAIARIAHEATEVLSDIAKSEPELLKPAAGDKIKWPLFRSLHKKYQSVEDKKEKHYLEAIGLGEKSRIRIERQLKYDPQNTATKIAQKLLEYVEAIRMEGRKRRARFLRYYRLIRRTEPNILKTTKLRDLKTEESDDDLAQKAMVLPNTIYVGTSRDAEWWKVAKAFLIESYPCLDEKLNFGPERYPPALRNIVPKVPKSRKRTKIFERLEDKFLQVLARKKLPESFGKSFHSIRK